jgi:hypothetical protein
VDNAAPAKNSVLPRRGKTSRSSSAQLRSVAEFTDCGTFLPFAAGAQSLVMLTQRSLSRAGSRHSPQMRHRWMAHEKADIECFETIRSAALPQGRFEQEAHRRDGAIS